MISIIIPVYNTEKYLRRCLDSIVAQTYKEFECILVDDGSTDASGKICDEYAAKDGRFKVFHKKNGGVSSARNLALEHIQGDYVTFCDSDDSVTNDWLEIFADKIEDCDLVVSSINLIEAKRTYQRIFDYNIQEMSLLWLVLQLSESAGLLWHKCFRSKIIEDNNIRFNENYKFCEDEEFIAHYAMFAKKVATSSKATYNYYVPDYEVKWKNALKFETINDIYEHTLTFIPYNSTLNKIYATFVERMLSCIKLYYKEREYAKAHDILKTASRIIKKANIPFIPKQDRFFIKNHTSISHSLYILLSLLHLL